MNFSDGRGGTIFRLERGDRPIDHFTALPMQKAVIYIFPTQPSATYLFSLPIAIEYRFNEVLSTRLL